MFGSDVLNFIGSTITRPSSNSTSHGSDVHTKDVCMFQRTTPSVSIFLVYGLAVPTLASFGLCANLINAVVFMRPKMTPSAFTYLAALSCLDSVSCLLILLTALARSYFYRSGMWIAFDYQWQTPLFGISTGAANLILACVSLDRFIYLWRFKSSRCAPHFCRRKIARLMISAVLLISVLTNLPYFFCFVVNLETGTCHVTDFYYSKYYQIHNWFSFALLALLPAVFLLIGNMAIIVAFRRWTKQGKTCQQSCAGNNNARTTQKRFQHQMKLTISILIVITLYMVGELPAHMTSRKSSLNLLFGGDTSKMDEEMMEHLEVIFITLNALQLSMNIVVYAVINPSFMPEFFLCLRGASDFCFHLCCLPHMALACKRCCTNWRQHPIAEECVVSSVEPAQLPADEAPHCGCESWSSDSACLEPSHTKANLEGTFAFVADGAEQWTEEEEQQIESKRQSEPEIFATKESGCMQLAVQQKPVEDATHLSGTINM
ncbi:uncharacterized protein LOC6568896 [Drosophila grimshawi]|uniref:GH22651 n=1 Tax=Drosophila grimshawi TaxID=7222 RepID=B4JVL1_DROGR|nr:uncharacterized protein LOC6568896 [Drosophila grimshawi]EDV98479.1 GH22651 [Drosophila grimshawi]